jgi:hypothetical protein
MKTLRDASGNFIKIGRFSLCIDKGDLYLRWWDTYQKKTISEKLAAKKLQDAKKEAKALIRKIEDPHRLVSTTSLATKNPRFREVWLGFEQEARQSLSPGRFSLLLKRLTLYYKPHLWNVKMDRLRPAMIQLRKVLLDKGLHPNTVSDILTVPRAVAVYAFDGGLSFHQAPGPITVAGTTAPTDRTPKGRYPTFAEIGGLIDLAAASPYRHILQLLLLELGCGGRIGAIAAINEENVHRNLMVINLLSRGEIESNKRKPIVPITGPMPWVIDECMDGKAPGLPLIRYRGKGIGTNLTQIILRLVEALYPDDEEKRKALNWYSIRRFLFDWLDGRVSDKALVMFAGHDSLLAREKDKIFDEASPTSDIYRRRKLAFAYQVGRVLNRDWWPEIQKHCSFDLKLPEAPAARKPTKQGKSAA